MINAKILRTILLISVAKQMLNNALQLRIVFHSFKALLILIKLSYCRSINIAKASSL